MGRSHAVRLAEEGADLILVDICASLPEVEYPLASRDDLEETARLVEKHGRRAIAHVVDVRDAAALAAAVDDGVAALGGLDASVANAGVLTVGTWDTTTSEQWRTVVDVNLIGTWNTCAAALPHLVERGGSLVNISSAAGLKGTPSAHALHGLQARCGRFESSLGQRACRTERSGQHGAPHRCRDRDAACVTARAAGRGPPRPGPDLPQRHAHRDGRGHSTSATRCCSWSPTRPGTSPGWNSRSTQGSLCDE